MLPPVVTVRLPGPLSVPMTKPFAGFPGRTAGGRVAIPSGGKVVGSIATACACAGAAANPLSVRIAANAIELGQDGVLLGRGPEDEGAINAAVAVVVNKSLCILRLHDCRAICWSEIF